MAKQCSRTQVPCAKTDDDLKLTDNLKAASQEDKFKYALRTVFIQMEKQQKRDFKKFLG